MAQARIRAGKGTFKLTLDGQPPQTITADGWQADGFGFSFFLEYKETVQPLGLAAKFGARPYEKTVKQVTRFYAREAVKAIELISLDDGKEAAASGQ